MPPWPNGQGVGLLIRRLRVRVPQGVHISPINSENFLTELKGQSKATPKGFEPPRAEPNGFRVHLLNRSDTVSLLALSVKATSGNQACHDAMIAHLTYMYHGCLQLYK